MAICKDSDCSMRRTSCIFIKLKKKSWLYTACQLEFHMTTIMTIGAYLHNGGSEITHAELFCVRGQENGFVNAPQSMQEVTRSDERQGRANESSVCMTAAHSRFHLCYCNCSTDCKCLQQHQVSWRQCTLNSRNATNRLAFRRPCRKLRDRPLGT
jgi:hypothetical protein